MHGKLIMGGKEERGTRRAEREIGRKGGGNAGVCDRERDEIGKGGDTYTCAHGEK